MEHPWRASVESLGRWRSSAPRKTITLGTAIAAAVLLTCVLGYELLRNTRQAVTISSSSGYPLNFLVVGDWGRDGDYNQRKVAREMGRVGEMLSIDFVISTGDNFYEYGLKGVDDPQFHTSFSTIYKAPSLQKAWYSVLGNHDYGGDVLAQLSEGLSQRDSRWKCHRELLLQRPLCGNSNTDSCDSFVDIFLIDTTPYVDEYWSGKNHPDLNWSGLQNPREDQLRIQTESLKRNLENSTSTWKIVVGHHPIRSSGHHGDTVELAKAVDPLLKAHDVDLYINGHDHHLESIKSKNSKLQYITSGAGSKAWRNSRSPDTENGSQFFYDGQGFVAVSGNRSSVRVGFHDAFGNVLHTLNLAKDN